MMRKKGTTTNWVWYPVNQSTRQVNNNNTKNRTEDGRKKALNREKKTKCKISISIGRKFAFEAKIEKYKLGVFMI